MGQSTVPFYEANRQARNQAYGKVGDNLVGGLGGIASSFSQLPSQLGLAANEVARYFGRSDEQANKVGLGIKEYNNRITPKVYEDFQRNAQAKAPTAHAIGSVISPSKVGAMLNSFGEFVVEPTVAAQTPNPGSQ